MAKNCVVCGQEVVWENVKEVFEDLLSQVDTLGEDSLTESEQTVYHGQICSLDCYDQL